MVLARVADFFTPAPTRSSLTDDGGRNRSYAMDTVERYATIGGTAAVEEEEVDDEAARPPYIHVCREPSALLRNALEETDED